MTPPVSLKDEDRASRVGVALEQRRIFQISGQGDNNTELDSRGCAVPLHKMSKVRPRNSPVAGKSRTKAPSLDIREAIESARLAFKSDNDPTVAQARKMMRRSASKSTLSSPNGSGKRASPPNTKENKSSSAPTTPIKITPTVGDKRKFDSPRVSLTSPKRMKAADANIGGPTKHGKPTSQGQAPTSATGGVLSEVRVKPPTARRKATPMDEVMKLHQDEGIYHLLHGLSGSRRKTQVRPFNASNPSVDTVIHPPALRKGTSLKFSLPTRVPTPQPSSGGGKLKSAVKGNLIIQDAPKITLELLTDPNNLEQMKKLPIKDYVDLWNANRGQLSAEALAAVTSPALDISVSPNSSSNSELSSTVSNLTAGAATGRARIGSRMLLCVSNITKQYREIQVRSYPTFAQIIVAPASTGMKFSFNITVFEEIIDAMQLLLEDHTCKAVVLTGLGQVFSQGVDLTLLTFESGEKQRKSAEIMARGIRTFVKFILNYPKLTVAVVNGVARGFGVTLLPFMDIVYASSNATFHLDYARIGQIPEGFASETMDSLAFSEMVLLGRGKTAEEAKALGLVTEVIWPDKLFEEVVPRLEALHGLACDGLQATKAVMKNKLRRVVSPIMDEETQNLQAGWTSVNFAKRMKHFLKTSDSLVLLEVFLIPKGLIGPHQAPIVVVELGVRGSKEVGADREASQVQVFGLGVLAHVVGVERGQVTHGQTHVEVVRTQKLLLDANGLEELLLG
eukprot:snap_masked-scaffold1962_size23816-processed-gene-0.4 protein:Tk01331 transcript:snap_masked-scaffold1962_size23816-processed-gene-0.4-mRNA-1 annotation:"chromodomain y-like protein"